MQSDTEKVAKFEKTLEESFHHEKPFVPDTTRASPKIMAVVPALMIGIVAIVIGMPDYAWGAPLWLMICYLLLGLIVVSTLRWMKILREAKRSESDAQIDALLEPKLHKTIKSQSDIIRAKESRIRALEIEKVALKSDFDRSQVEIEGLEREVNAFKSQEHIDERLRVLLRTTSQVGDINNKAIKEGANLAKKQAEAVRVLAEATKKICDAVGLPDALKDTHVQPVAATAPGPAVTKVFLAAEALPPLRLMGPMPPTPTNPFNNPMMGDATVGVEPREQSAMTIEGDDSAETHDTQVSNIA